MATLRAAPFSSPLGRVSSDGVDLDTSSHVLASWVGTGSLDAITLQVISTGSPVTGWTTGFSLQSSIGGVPLVGNLLAPVVNPSTIGAVTAAGYWYPGPELNSLAGVASPGVAPSAVGSLQVATQYVAGAWSFDAANNLTITVTVMQSFPMAGQLTLSTQTFSQQAGTTCTVRGRAIGSRLFLAAL